MLKQFATDDHGELIDAAGGSAFQFFERSDKMTKSASDAISKKDVEAYMPPDGQFGVHLISLGSEEHFGCVSADTPIAMADGRHLNIGDVAVGDIVMSGHGKPRAVLHKFEYDLETALKFKVGGLCADLVVSPNHPFMVTEKALLTCSRDKYKRCMPPIYGTNEICSRGAGCNVGRAAYPELVSNYVEAEQVGVGDFLVYQIPEVKPEEDISEEEAVVIGYWLAEGCFYNGHSLQFAFDAAERYTWVAELEKNAVACGWKFKCYGPYPSRPNSISVRLTGRGDRARKYAEWFGNGAWNKKIPFWFHGLPDRVLGCLLKCYTAGDGAITSSEQVQITTVSRSLALGVQSLFWKLGIAATSYYYEQPSNKGKSKMLKGYRVVYAISKVPDVLDYLRFGHVADLKQNSKIHVFILRGKVYLPVRAIEELCWNDKIYTLEVEVDHSYVSANVWSKNSNRNGDSWSDKCLDNYHSTFEKFGCVFREHKNKCQKTQGVGQVKLARVNHKMHRGELIIWVDKDKAPDMYKSAKSGKELSFSMSCKLPFDRCSCCDHRAKRTTDYCNHLKNSMLKYVPEFRKFAHARNEDDVKFFDISEVKRRADRIATFLGYSFSPDDMAKAASEDRVITGAEWADHYGNTEPVAFAPWEAETLRKLAAEVSFVKHADQHTLNVLVASLPRALDHADLEKLAKADFRSVGGELANRGIILDFGSFASIVIGRPVSDLRKEADFRDIEGLRIPELIESMQEQEGCECGDEAANAVAPDAYGCAFSSEKDAIDNLMDDVAENLELKPQAASERAMTITIKMASIPQLQKVASFEPFYNALAESYGHYLVKAAHLAKDAPGVSANMLFRSVAAMQIFQAQKDCQVVRSRA